MKSQVIAIMAAVMLVLSLATAVPTMIASVSAQISSPPPPLSQEQLQECEQLDIPTANCNDLTIEAKKRLTGAQLETGSESTPITNHSIISATNVTSIPNFQSTAIDSNRIFESEGYGFRLQIPQDWVAQDTSEEEPQLGLRDSEDIEAAMLCKEDEALPDIGGTYNCKSAETTVAAVVTVYPNLQSRLNVSTISTSDLVALFINNTEQETFSSAYDFRIENSTDVDEFTKIVHTAYKTNNLFGSTTWRTSSLFVLSEDRNTGYSVVGHPIYNSTTGAQTESAAPMHKMFNSFELIVE